ncbi:MAG TPA: ACT domain-containing protein [Coriobacteriia bacterium]
MATARMASQIAATIPARVGLLADVCDALSKAGVNIASISAYERDGVGKFLLVTSDNAKAMAALGRLNAESAEWPVLVVEMENRPGALEAIARTMAEAGINVDYCYGTVAADSNATVVFRTSDDMKALSLF